VAAGADFMTFPGPQKYNPTMLSVVVQAGGQSQRMGENKALKLFLGRPLIERVLSRLQPIADELILTTNEPEMYELIEARKIADLRPGLGPLGGLHTALSAARFETVAVVACDMPFANPSLLVAAANILEREHADVAIAESPEGFEPMHAVYRRLTCLPAIEAAIDSGKRRAISWFPAVSIRRLTPDELRQYDPEGIAFWNVNTPEEFARAEQLARTGGS
jgi:molybdenum cofactor guanylyltransferase